MFEENLLNYGMAGIFIAYLIYDRQILMRKLKETIDRNTEATNNLTKMVSRLCSNKK